MIIIENMIRKTMCYLEQIHLNKRQWNGGNLIFQNNGTRFFKGYERIE